MVGAMDVGVLVGVEADEAVDHLLGLVRRRGVVQPDERVPVDPFGQNREVAPEHVSVQGGTAAPRYAGPGRATVPRRVGEVELRRGGTRRCAAGWLRKDH